MSSAAFHPDSVTTLEIVVDNEVVLEWDGTPGSSEMQTITGVEGVLASDVTIQGVLASGEYFGILEVQNKWLHAAVPMKYFIRPAFALYK